MSASRYAAAAALAALCLLALPASEALAQPGPQRASIRASFSPYRLGAFTALHIGFQIRAAGGGLPSPLTGIVYHYPRQIGLTRTELGLAACRPQTLQQKGPQGCPRNSIMGAGTAIASFQVSPAVSEEPASLAVVAAPSPTGYLKLLISATGGYPVFARLIMSTLLLPGRLSISVPLLKSVPEAPDVAVTDVSLTLGGRLTYYERRNGRRIAFHPKGVSLPPRCPRGGFHFSATFSFLDGTTASAGTVVSCPRLRHGHTAQRPLHRPGRAG